MRKNKILLHFRNYIVSNKINFIHSHTHYYLRAIANKLLNKSLHFEENSVINQCVN